MNTIIDTISIWTTAQKLKTSGRGRKADNQSLHGINKLRELILDLAIRGKLVPQDLDDEPASLLLRKIAAEKKRLIKEGITKKQISSPNINENEKPYNLPTSWEWVRLTDLYYSISPSGKKLKSSEIVEVGELPVVDQGKSYIAGYTDNVSLLIEIPGPVIIFGDHTTAIKYIDFNFVAGADGTKILRPFKMDERYFHTYLLSYKLENRGYARHFKVLNDNLMAFPPLAEQHRIVAKVDELMALCDELEQQQSDSNSAHEILIETLLDTLTNAPDQAELETSWQRITNHFDVLFTTEHSIDRLKQTILQLAVMGKLVPQNPDDEPANVLLKKIAKEKARLVKEKQIRKQDQLPELSVDEKPFEIPMGWIWVRLGELCFTVADGPHFSPQYVDKKDGLPFLSGRNITVDSIDLSTAKYISKKDYDEFCKRIKPKKGDILYTKGGTTGIAKANDLEIEFSVWVHVAVLQIPNDKIFNRYLALALNSPHCYEQSQRYTHGTGNKDLGLTRMILISVTFPPLAEQHRIVAKVDELFAVCDALKERINESQVTQLNLADALVDGAVG